MPFSSRERLRFVIGVAILLCFIAFSGCTQPLIPSPEPVSTTSAPVVTTRAPVTRTVTTIATPTMPSYLAYSNPQYEFSISYPSGWTKQENAGTSVVVFTSPSTGSISDIPATMKIAVDTDNTLSLEQYKTAQLTKRQNLDNYNMIYDQAYKGNGFSGWKVAYTANQGFLTKWVEVYAIRGSTAYTVAYSSKEDKYAGYVVQMDAMFKSFQLTS